jgi:hypothetical protein
LADARGGTIKTLDSLYKAQHGSIQVKYEYESNRTSGMSSLVSKVGGDGHILLHSRNHFVHRWQLEKLFVRLRNSGLKVSFAKIEFGAINVSYLGFRLTPDRIISGSNKLRAIRDSKANTVQEIRQFMGLCIFFAHMSKILLHSVPPEQINIQGGKLEGGGL